MDTLAPQNNFTKLIEEYTENYCLYLEATYEKGMMSEGGTDAIDKMFAGVNLNQKSLLEIGFGLGGAACYLAEKYDTTITGIELNPWMVNEATARLPQHLKNKVHFICYETPPLLPIPTNFFNIVYSKGVLVHVADKSLLFREIHRTLKPTGELIIDDWLSPMHGRFGNDLQTLCEIENLSLYAETEESYRYLLHQAGFKNITFRNENPNYSRYNQNIIERMQDKLKADAFIQKFGHKAWEDAIQGYQLIKKSIDSNELLIHHIRATM